MGEPRNHAMRRSGSRVFRTSLEARSEVEKKKTALVYMVVCFVCVLFNVVIYVFYCYVYVLVLLCMLCNVCSVSVCCSVYCLCVNVYCITATMCQRSCS